MRTPRKLRDDAAAGSDAHPVRGWHDIIQELRVTQTGTQILSGFLLSIAFQQVFQKLESGQKLFYLVLVILAAVTTTMTLIPVGLHNELTARSDQHRLDVIADRILTAVLVLVSCLTAGIVYFVFDVVSSQTVALVIGAITVVGMLTVLVVVPKIMRGRRTTTSPAGHPRLG